MRQFRTCPVANGVVGGATEAAEDLHVFAVGGGEHNEQVANPRVVEVRECDGVDRHDGSRVRDVQSGNEGRTAHEINGGVGNRSANCRLYMFAAVAALIPQTTTAERVVFIGSPMFEAG